MLESLLPQVVRGTTPGFVDHVETAIHRSPAPRTAVPGSSAKTIGTALTFADTPSASSTELFHRENGAGSSSKIKSQRNSRHLPALDMRIASA